MVLQLDRQFVCIILVEVSYSLTAEKVNVIFVGPLAIYQCISSNQFLFMCLDAVLYPMVIEEARL